MTAVGAALLALSGLMAGLSLAGRYRRQVREARSLCRLLELMLYELSRFLTPLPELFAGLADRTEGAASSICVRAAAALGREDVRFREAWRFACGGLPAGERELLLPLGEVLGRYGAREQAEALEDALARTRRYCEGLEASLPDRCRLALGLLTAGGLLAAVLLW